MYDYIQAYDCSKHLIGRHYLTSWDTCVSDADVGVGKYKIGAIL